MSVRCLFYRPRLPLSHYFHPQLNELIILAQSPSFLNPFTFLNSSTLKQFFPALLLGICSLCWVSSSCVLYWILISKSQAKSRTSLSSWQASEIETSAQRLEEGGSRSRHREEWIPGGFVAEKVHEKFLAPTFQRCHAWKTLQTDFSTSNVWAIKEQTCLLPWIYETWNNTTAMSALLSHGYKFVCYECSLIIKVVCNTGGGWW